MSRLEVAISALEADRALDGLKRFDHLILAVSGGPDSLAMAYLAVEWRSRLGSPPPVMSVATVDHGLRSDSAREAEIVAQHCRSLGIEHATLRWEGVKPRSGIINAARDARYGLLDAHAQSIGGSGKVAVITAHHQDDQAETVFMRLARGGGVEALAAMSPERPLAGGSSVRLVRPFLGFPKVRLVASLAARGVTWIEDPTNTDCKLERTRVRQSLASSGLNAAAVAMTAGRMQEAREGLDYAAAQFKQTLQLSYNNGVYASFDWAAFDAAPAVLRCLVLTTIVRHFGGTTPNPEVSQVEALVSRIAAAGAAAGPTRATLGGTVITTRKNAITVWRELGRLEMSGVELTAATNHVPRQCWDDRFWVSIDCQRVATVTVKPLGLRGFETLAGMLGVAVQLPKDAVCGLPSFWADATLLTVPQLGLQTAAGDDLCTAVISEPLFQA